MRRIRDVLRLSAAGMSKRQIAASLSVNAEEDPLVHGAYQTYELGTWLISNRQNNYHPNIQAATRK